MSVIVDAVVGPIIVEPLVESIVVRIKKQVGFFFRSTKYVEDMSNDRGRLNNLMDSVDSYVNHNNVHNLGVPAQVTAWLNDVKVINAQVLSMNIYKPGRCFNFKNRRVVGSIAYKITEDIKKLIDEYSKLVLSGYPIPLGIVNSTVASTSAPPSSDHDEFPTRELTFASALEALGPDHKSSRVALWGMGGVGKSTMVEKLEKAVKKRGWFQLIVNVSVGKDMNVKTLQSHVADYICKPLEETGENARAEKLRISFESQSKGENILVILDNIWESFDLKDIGLDPLPREGACFKFLLTSRDKNICRMMGVEENSIFYVDLLSFPESQNLFYKLVSDPDEAYLDSELQKVGVDILNECHRLPMAIETIAKRVKGKKKYVWDDALLHLKDNKSGNFLNNIFELSYKNLKHGEAEAILLLCGVFPKDLDIPKEELLRYGWGLKLFENVSTIKDARNRLFTCIDKLTDTNFLTASYHAECVSMHDLVRDFVLGKLSQGEHASIIYHGVASEWRTDDTCNSCTRISVTIRNGIEFPTGVKFPNLSFLKVIQGDESFKFPQDFYGGMVKLEVIGFERMVDPLLPMSFPFSSNIRVLCIHQCSLTFDYSSIGNLRNLEVLSFANSGIEELPSTIGNLVKLKTLDVTGCFDILIDDDILRKLVNLEELYMIPSYGRIISFTDESCNWLADISKNLTALEIELRGRNSQPKKLSIEKVERFAIYMGHGLNIDTRSHGINTLKLVTCKDDLLESRINELFGKTEILNLEVDDMNFLEDVMVKSPHMTIYNSTPQHIYFSNLKVFKVSKCNELGYLFTFNVATTLSNLEYLEVSRCNMMETLIHIDNGEERAIIIFRKLKVLSLYGLPELSGLCNTANVIMLPQLLELQLSSLSRLTSIYTDNKLATSSMLSSISATQHLLNAQVVIPMLEVLIVTGMENLKAIWPCQYGTNEEANVSLLRVINVERCRSLVNLFPENPVTLLHHLEILQIRGCDSLPVLFNINLDYLGKTVQLCSSLRSIEVSSSRYLREIWSIKGENEVSIIIGGVQVVKIHIRSCENFRTVASATTFLYLKPLMELKVLNYVLSWKRNKLVKSNQEEKINVNVMFPSYLTSISNHLVNIRLTNSDVDVVFEIASPSSQKSVNAQNSTQQQPLLLLPSYLNKLELSDMERMSHVWKCNWTEFLPQECSFLNLTTIVLSDCNNIRYLFSPLMAEFLPNLTEVNIRRSYGMEEVVSSRDDGEMRTSMHTRFPLFPRLSLLNLEGVHSLERIGGGATKDASNEISDKYSQVGGAVSWSLCQYSRQIRISGSDVLACVVPFYAFSKMHQLQVLQIDSCKSMLEVFESQGINNSDAGSTTYADERRDSGTSVVLATPRVKEIEVPQLTNLKEVDINGCDNLQYVFTFSTLESLSQLEALKISDCEAMKVIVKDDDDDDDDGHTTASKVVFFPRLRSIALYNLPSLEGFFLGKNDIEWPILDDVIVMNCAKMTIFTCGQSTAKKLKFISTSLGTHSLDSELKVKTKFPDTESTHSQQLPWSFHNLSEMIVKNDDSIRRIVPSIELLHLQKLVKIFVSRCDHLEEVFEVAALEEKNDRIGFNESQKTVVELPNLTEVDLEDLSRLKYIWKSNQWTVVKFPYLTRISVVGCRNLEYVFTSSMVGSLVHLQELHVSHADAKVIVKEEEECEGKVNEHELQHLKSLKLVSLPYLKGFCLGKDAFSWPSLDSLRIFDTPKINVFTIGHSDTPILEEIKTSFGECNVGNDLNSFIKTNQQSFQEFILQDENIVSEVPLWQIHPGNIE